MNRRVLIVDDDCLRNIFLIDLLTAHDYEVYVAGSGGSALEITDELQTDLILLDISMPHKISDMDGIETCKRLKASEEGRSIPIIFLTDRDDEDFMVRAFDAGAADYLLKPFDTRVLLARVHTHIEAGILSRHLEEALAERTEELNEANTQLRYLAMEMSLIEEREKQRLAGDLHDGPMQKLALAQMRIEAACLAGPGDKADQHVASGLGLMRDALQELRLLQFELSPPILYQSGLEAALKWLASHATRHWGLPFSFAAPSTRVVLDQELSIALFQFARELVVNVVKHAEATRGEISLDSDATLVLLTVEDNGSGFAPTSATDPSWKYHGFGLFSIRERLHLLGGTLEVDSGSEGSRVTLSVPTIPTASVTEAETRERP